MQQLAMESRLGIPLLIGIDAVHGCGLVSGTTVYPTSIGMASTFDPELVYVSSRQTALEMRALGMHWSLLPTWVARINVVKVGETFGEDPLVSLIRPGLFRVFRGTTVRERFGFIMCQTLCRRVAAIERNKRCSYGCVRKNVA